MRAVIGDTGFNLRFLRLAVAACGFDEIVGATSATELLACAPDADLVVYDPLVRPGSAPVTDVGLELLRRVPADRLLIVTCSATELHRARRNGIVAARKGSLFDLRGLELAIMEALNQAHDASPDRSRATPTAPDVEARPVAALFDWDELARTSANASVAALPARSTSQS